MNWNRNVKITMFWLLCFTNRKSHYFDWGDETWNVYKFVVPSMDMSSWENIFHKKVPLCDRKRCTADCVASTRSSELFPGRGLPKLQLGLGYPPPPAGTRVLSQFVLGYPQLGLEYTPPQLEQGYPPPGKDLRPGTRERTLDLGSPLWMDRHLWKHYLPTSLRNAGSNNLKQPC